MSPFKSSGAHGDYQKSRVQRAHLAGLFVALAACSSLHATERHNIILFVPQVLSAASADDGSAAALTAFRDDGVNFLESHSRFPPLATPDERMAAEFNKDALIQAAAAAQYSAVFLQDSDVDPVVTENLRSLKEKSRPFLLIYRVLGNTPRSANDALATIQQSLKDLALYDATNIIVAAEHGGAGVWKASRTSLSVTTSDDDPENEIGQLPTGFLAIDVAAILQKAEPRISLFDPDQGNKPLDWIAGNHPVRGNALIGTSPTNPRVVVEARGGHDFLFLPPQLSRREARELAEYLVGALFKQDYVSGMFVNEKRVGRIRGALSQEYLGWPNAGDARVPDIVVNFASVTSGCQLPMTCAFAIADTPLEEGDDILGAFSRADTWTFMAARGPDFRRKLLDRVPASNADVARTILELIAPPGKDSKAQWPGRVLMESLRGYEQKPVPEVKRRVVASKPADDGIVTEVALQAVGTVQYFDAAGFPGWTVGLQYRDAPLGPWWHWDWPRPRSMTITISPD